MEADRPNVSFSGCGFLGLYHVGVASCLKTYAPQLRHGRVSGASAGAMAAISLLVDLPLGEMTSNVLRVANEARTHTLGPFAPGFKLNQIIYDGMEKLMPENVHTLVNGRLHVSLTKVYDGKNILVSQYSSKMEVIEVVLASTFIPIFSGWLPPRYRGIRVIDGGYSDNLPVLDAHTITVSPFCGSADICPQDDQIFNHVVQVNVANTSIELTKENLWRLGRVLLPPDPEVLSKYCKAGFEDALRFLQKRYLISCTRCLAVDSTYEIEEEPLTTPTSTLLESEGCKEYDPDCLECKLQRHIASQSTVPENVWQVFERSINEAEGGVASWFLTIRANRLFRMLTYPAKLPISVAQGLINRLTHLLPTLTLEAKSMVESLIEQLIHYATLGGLLTKPAFHSARYSCDISLTQYGEDSMTDLHRFTDKERQESVKDLLSLSFTTTLESKVPPLLPSTQETALQFQTENLSAAVSQSRIPSRVGSLVTSRRGSLAVSRALSRVNSRMGSRSCSMNSLQEDGELPETLGSIQALTENQTSVMSYYYTDKSNQVKVLEIFDVTETDPSVFMSNDMQGVHYTKDDQVLPPHHDKVSRLRHYSAPHASSSRRHSVQIERTSSLNHSRGRNPSLQLANGPLSKSTGLIEERRPTTDFLVGGDSDGEEETGKLGVTGRVSSDPESEGWR